MLSFIELPVFRILLLLMITRIVFGQDADTSFPLREDFLDYDQNSRYRPEIGRKQYQFKTSDITNLNQELRNLTTDYANRKLPVGVYIYGGRFLQITNLQNKDAWSTLPFSDESLRQIGILFNTKTLDVTGSTLRVGSIPASILHLNMSQTKMIDGSLSDVLRRCDQLETLSIDRSGDIKISDLSATPNIQLLETRGLSIIYAPSVQLPKVHWIRFYEDTFVDPRILREFEQIFVNLESIGLDQTHYGILKRNLIGIPSLNWINIWNLNVRLVKDETEWDGLIIRNQNPSNTSSTNIVTLVKEGRWKYFKYP